MLCTRGIFTPPPLKLLPVATILKPLFVWFKSPTIRVIDLCMLLASLLGRAAIVDVLVKGLGSPLSQHSMLSDGCVLLACVGSCLPLLRRFHELGCDVVNAKAKNLSKALAFAAEQGSLPCMEFLVSLGMSVTEKNKVLLWILPSHPTYPSGSQ